MNERVRLVLEHTEGPTVLDLGAVQHDADHSDDEDWLHGHLSRRFDRVIGVDILCEEVEKLNNEGFEMVCADVTEMDYPLEADTVVAGELIEHVADAGQMLERVADHLKPGGKFIITTPNPWAWIFLVRLKQRGMHVNDEHVSWYGPKVMEQLLERHGFELERTEIATRKRAGIMAWLQRLGIRPFNGTTWVFIARKQ